MKNHNTAVQIAPATVDFHGSPLMVITGQNGEHLVAMKPICENIGLQWEAQLKRLKRDEVLSTCMSIMDIQMPGDDQHREVTCLPLEYLNGWLFGIDINRCREEIRPILIQYKRECYSALAAYFQKGEAVNPRKAKKPKALLNGLTTEQQEAIKGLVKARVDSLPQDKRAKAAVKCWSALKNTFGCTYKKIDSSQFTDAVSLVARLELEGEFLGKDDQSKLEPFAQIIGRPLKPIERWIVYTDGRDKEQYRPIPLDSFVMTPAKLLYVMANTPDAPIPTQDLFDFVVAALSKLKAVRAAKTTPQEEFNEGAKMVAQRFLEGEFLGKEPEPKPLEINFPVSRWLKENPELAKRQSGYNKNEIVVGIHPLCAIEAPSPTQQLLTQLEQAGFNVDACQCEYQAMRDHLGRLNRIFSEINRHAMHATHFGTKCSVKEVG